MEAAATTIVEGVEGEVRRRRAPAATILSSDVCNLATNAIYVFNISFQYSAQRSSFFFPPPILCCCQGVF